jgi:hypothetical protein
MAEVPELADSPLLASCCRWPVGLLDKTPFLIFSSLAESHHAHDPEVYRRVRARAERITAELRRKYGDINISADLIGEVRDEE